MAWGLLARERMNVGIYKGAAAMNSLERWQAAISQNLASEHHGIPEKRDVVQWSDGRTDESE